MSFFPNQISYEGFATKVHRLVLKIWSSLYTSCGCHILCCTLYHSTDSFMQHLSVECWAASRVTSRKVRLAQDPTVAGFCLSFFGFPWLCVSPDQAALGQSSSFKLILRF